MEKIHNVYFLGIGGIGMSALARYFVAEGKAVAGYDLTPSPVTNELEKLGIDIHFSEDVSKIPASFMDRDLTLVVRTPAVPEKHAEYLYLLEKGFTIRKRSVVLGMLFNQNRGLAVAGTHGKTSVSSMLATIMHSSEKGCTAFLGGILKNVNSNFILDKGSPWVVTEADEYDRSFLRLTPEMALVTWVDADHLDIYASKEDIDKAFSEFIHQTKEGGTVILKKGIPLKLTGTDRNLYTYALEDRQADFHARNVVAEKGRYVFDLVTPGGEIPDIRLRVIGITNVENAVAAASLAWAAGIDPDTIRRALSAFEGVKRRFDIQFTSGDRLYIDDYAHHPRELDAVIGSLRQLFPERRITGVFQPHLFSRTKDFATEFAASLSALDELVLMEIYPAREAPVEGVNSCLILDQVSLAAKEICSREELVERLKNMNPEILLTAGAGDIDRFVEPLKKMMESL
ncbi:MAG: UDP-N-acetylmuramate--L-alanine ligase [Bacteroidales bacterium]|nr:UDP-N-acetylmuramate--L-alanine ligase [Bacteroidales bacterium]